MTGDALVVLTHSSLHALNSTFGRQLQDEAGSGYKEELSEAKRVPRGDKRVVVTSGGETSYYAVIHVPVGSMVLHNDVQTIQEIHSKALEEGIRHAAALGSRQTVICTEAVRTDQMDWEEGQALWVDLSLSHKRGRTPIPLPLGSYYTSGLTSDIQSL